MPFQIKRQDEAVKYALRIITPAQKAMRTQRKQRQLQKCALILKLEKKRSEACGQKGKQTRKNCVRNLLSARFPRHEPQGLSSEACCSCSFRERRPIQGQPSGATERCARCVQEGGFRGSGKGIKGNCLQREAITHDSAISKATSNEPTSLKTLFFKHLYKIRKKPNKPKWNTPARPRSTRR